MSLWIKLVNKRFIIFTIILALKGMLAWDVIFDSGVTLETFITEIPFFWAIFCVIEWFATRRKLFYYMVFNFLVTILYFSILMYYKYYGIIATYHVLDQASKVTQVGESTYSLLDPYYLLIFLDIIVLSWFLIWGKRKSVVRPIVVKQIRKPVLTVLFAFSIALCLFNIWPNKASMNEHLKAEDMGLLNYEMYTIFADSTADEEWVEMEDITQKEIDRLKGDVQPLQPQFEGVAKGKNLIILQMESLQNFLIDLKVDGQEITPNLNKLLKADYHFDHFYTMVGQGTTSDAEFVVNTSLYVPKHEPATKNNVSKQLPSLPKLLSVNGYTTATFHTNDVSFWNRTELYAALGFDAYYDKAYFGDEDHVAFGASDEVLYRKTIEKLKQMDNKEQPFYAQVISMSAHHPFNTPEEKLKITLPEKYDDTLLGDYLRAQNYADFALGQFIADLKSSGLWEDTVIMLYGDHQGVSLFSLDDEQKAMMNELIGHEYTYSDMFNVPFYIHVPGVTEPKTFDHTGGQVDILPTIANLYAISLDDQIYFGKDLLNQTKNMLPMRHFLPTGSLIGNETLFMPGFGYEDGTNIPLPQVNGDPSLVAEDEYERTLELLHLSDSYIAQLPDR
ncbi:MAG: LTA synthase family protein [Candidatus Cohnella colombiensis]|uniref:LTA synthase family protein n=1 Tax=Candidatus Cohnella colombiensis TaxID=3121368 RepID=A0AA95JBZ2_9BACL|nr:MAG: LTA synthase family protein [Cohnella sp.]